ncbi:MAG: hydrolase TatD [Candidatus Zambryskibacteria bacterium CG22_combo_CG10-13_8_21_14_all_42_17]|uniref:Hydrolase TatD n=1 Tax=Candidatus Zambryskibacteria bacterium CG22_combo_CG10-13_8_21_14_all_42_17 TaxID=1975118 RepID=A0A2H0BF42_9BACT|nr:MAG: hydrolase TatD [Candidatus Zambryskibacteria bacterium CG22_combo_CG10-13_8_21_14_all_42_17]
MPRYFDIHSHLNFPDKWDNFEEVLKRLKDTETYTIVVGTDFKSSKMAVDLAQNHEEIYACIGVHPVDDPHQTFEREKFDELVKHPKVVAIGECGMDFFHTDKDIDYNRQKKLFLNQVNFALDYDKPIMIHARDAYEELLEILEPIKKEAGSKFRGNVHFFAGSPDIAQRFFNMGFSISFTGVITFTRDYDYTIRTSPLNMIMSETDAPYVAPVPHRGKRNEPSYVSEVVKRIAEIRGEDEEKVRVALVNNALSMIG